MVSMKPLGVFSITSISSHIWVRKWCLITCPDAPLCGRKHPLTWILSFHRSVHPFFGTFNCILCAEPQTPFTAMQILQCIANGYCTATVWTCPTGKTRYFQHNREDYKGSVTETTVASHHAEMLFVWRWSLFHAVRNRCACLFLFIWRSINQSWDVIWSSPDSQMSTNTISQSW